MNKLEEHRVVIAAAEVSAPPGHGLEIEPERRHLGDNPP